MNEYWIWLQNLLGYGSNTVKSVIERYGNAKNVYETDTEDLKVSGLFSAKAIKELNNRDLNVSRKILKDSIENSIRVIPYNSEYYPDCLKEIENPPVVLYAKGNIEILKEKPIFCIVGPREISPFGKKAAFSLSARLASGGFTIVTGIAKGGDTATIKGALAADKNIISVLPCGLDKIYPNDSYQLRQKILEKGLLISEFQVGCSVTKYSFHIRNRIMSGLSEGVAVIEAREKSGVLITASHAAEQGRDVFVIPGNPTSMQYKGSNKLIADGARPLLSANDIFSEYSDKYLHKLSPKKAFSTSVKFSDTDNSKNITKNHTQKKIIKKNIQDNLSLQAKTVYNCLDKEIFYPEEIKTDNISDMQLLSVLTELEIFGYIEALPGGRYTLK